MVSKTPAEWISIIAPEFIPPKYDVNGAIELAKVRMGITDTSKPDMPEDILNSACAYLACHILTVGGRPSGSSGDISSIQEGATSITYSTNKTKPSSSITGLVETSFGLEYINLTSPYRVRFYI